MRRLQPLPVSPLMVGTLNKKMKQSMMRGKEKKKIYKDRKKLYVLFD